MPAEGVVALQASSKAGMLGPWALPERGGEDRFVTTAPDLPAPRPAATHSPGGPHHPWRHRGECHQPFIFLRNLGSAMCVEPGPGVPACASVGCSRARCPGTQPLARASARRRTDFRHQLGLDWPRKSCSAACSRARTSCAGAAGKQGTRSPVDRRRRGEVAAPARPGCAAWPGGRRRRNGRTQSRAGVPDRAGGVPREPRRSAGIWPGFSCPSRWQGQPAQFVRPAAEAGRPLLWSPRSTGREDSGRLFSWQAARQTLPPGFGWAGTRSGPAVRPVGGRLAYVRVLRVESPNQPRDDPRTRRLTHQLPACTAGTA